MENVIKSYGDNISPNSQNIQDLLTEKLNNLQKVKVRRVFEKRLQ